MTTISLAPLQGFTDFPLRNALNKHIGGVDKYYTPYLRLQNDGTLKKANLRDVLPENNQGIHVIPQILVNNTKDFLHLSNMLADFGYSEVNWNLGCPYPMVAKRKLGSGLLPHSDEIETILEEVSSKVRIKISIKIRSGYENYQDIEKLIPVFNNFNLEELIIHPRFGKQLYKGLADKEVFRKCNEIYQHNIAYNGDIISKDDIHNLSKTFDSVNHIMIGRGLLQNLFLAKEFKSCQEIESHEKQRLFSLFHDDLYAYYKEALSGDSHQLNKMVQLWEYFSFLFEDRKKLYKRLKKCKTLHAFNIETQSAIKNNAFNTNLLL